MPNKKTKQTLTDAWPQSKPINIQEQQTWLSTMGILQEQCKKCQEC